MGIQLFCASLCARLRHLRWVSLVLAALGPSMAYTATLPPGFQEKIVFSGLTQPTAIRFSQDGRVFVAEKQGVVKVFDSLTDSTPDVFADLNVNVYNFWDRGLLSLALHPNFPQAPYVYVLYTYDAEPGGTAPRWGTPGVYSDPCPSPPGATGDGCVVTGRLSRLVADGNRMIDEDPLITDWCQQYPSHSIGSLLFGPDGALYVSGGDGSSFNFVDWGQDGNPVNPCGDPPGDVGGSLTPPTAEGGSLRSQDLRTSGDPVTLDGAILRLDPSTGSALPDNPLFNDPDENARRIVAFGLRNPFRIASRPGTNEIWIGDVGWNNREEIDRILTPTAAPIRNFGWPCYEGTVRQAGYDLANLAICENLYAQTGAAIGPYFSYAHSSKVVAGETCPTGSSSITGLAFYAGGSYPSTYRSALFFADYSRDCIWAMLRGLNGLPSKSKIQTFVAAAANPVDLQVSPDGELYYVDLNGGTIRRIVHVGVNKTPTAVVTANPLWGAVPLTVNFDGTGSSDPDVGDTLSYAWDLDGDGQFHDSTSPTASFTYTEPATTIAVLRVTDDDGASSTDQVVIQSGNTPPTATINLPPGTTWKVGDVISFEGSATDDEDGELSESALSWSLVIQHCPSNCHSHTIEDFVGVNQGSFSAPDHEYPSHLELQLTATDSGGLRSTTTARLDPQTVLLTFTSSPKRFTVAFNGVKKRAPFSRRVIIGSSNTISVTPTQSVSGRSYTFVSWSDGGAATHTIVAPSVATTYQAVFQ
jgi:glucose/arabinose dehydrogenase